MKVSLLLLVALTSFGAVEIHSQELLRLKSTFDTGGRLADVAFSPDGQTMLRAGRGNHAMLWQINEE